MKRTKTIALVVLVMVMSFTIGVSAGGKWKGSQVVDNIRNEQVQTIRDLFKTKNDEIKELKEDNKDYDKIIKDLQKEIKDKNKTIEDKDKEIGKINKDLMDAKGTIKIQEDELDYALQDVKAIQADLGEIITEQSK